MQYMIGMDIGTTSTKAVLYDQNGQIYAQANEGYELYRDATGMAEEDPAEILTAVITTLATVVRTIDFKQNELKGISFSSANQSLLVLDQNHQPLTRLLTWADTRAAKHAEQIKNSPRGQALYEKTGTPHHPMTLLAKISWLKANKPALYAKAAYYCGIKEYILYQLCGTWQMDISIASCTGLFNIFTQKWDPEALELAGVNVKQLPPVVDAYAQFSGLKPEYVQQT
ncbi:FGGY family carbohydrate kinase, partial [Ligilactobacillus salitolerans]|uniref:FGGY family carbohydrate kinase n=1 Tax=Ligilactobacillus salitolerans TaxID=1808352 RepID=UPI00227A862C